MTPLEQAITVDSELLAKLESAKAALVLVDSERKALAYGAHTGNAKAKGELDTLNRKRAAHALDLDGPEVALAHAGAGVDGARREAGRAVEVETASKVRAIADAAAGRGARIAEAARTLRDEVLRLTADLDETRRLGATIVNGRLVSRAMTRTILAILREAGKVIDIIPPGMRHDPQKLVDDYMNHARAWADKQLSEASPSGDVEAAWKGYVNMKSVLFKRDESANRDPKRLLIGSIESILDDDALDNDDSRVQMLIDTVHQYIVYTGADADRVKPGAPKAQTFVSEQSPDIVIADLVKRVAGGEPTKMSRGFFEKLARYYGERDRRDGETIEKARARFHESAQGRLLNEAAMRAPVVEPAKSPPTRGPALVALHTRADEIAASEALSRSRAKAKIVVSTEPRDRARWQSAKVEGASRAS